MINFYKIHKTFSDQVNKTVSTPFGKSTMHLINNSHNEYTYHVIKLLMFCVQNKYKTITIVVDIIFSLHDNRIWLDYLCLHQENLSK